MADKEYIERGALLENLKKQYGEELGWQCPVNMSDVGMMIEDAPAADVVEVVRCRDCKHWEHEEDVDFVCKRHYGYRLSTDFCSYGERKEQT